MECNSTSGQLAYLQACRYASSLTDRYTDLTNHGQTNLLAGQFVYWVT